ncbi:two-component regulator propeller domain-containing protein, partial [Enterobacter hormaechei]
ILSIAKDRNSTIWVGTDDGIAWIRCTSDIFNISSCEAEIPVIKQGAFNGFLFKGEQVQTIAVDGANRKWVGTKNGAWLISEDGTQILEHFTSA